MSEAPTQESIRGMPRIGGYGEYASLEAGAHESYQYRQQQALISVYEAQVMAFFLPSNNVD